MCATVYTMVATLACMRSCYPYMDILRKEAPYRTPHRRTEVRQVLACAAHAPPL